MLHGYKFKTCCDLTNQILHCPSTEVESVAPLCPGEHLPPPCGYHHAVPAAVGLVLCRRYLPLIVIDPDIVPLTGAVWAKVHCRLEGEGDSPHPLHRDCEHSWEDLLKDI